MEVGDKIEVREGHCTIIAVSGSGKYKAVIFDRGVTSRDRYVVGLYMEGDRGYTAPYFTNSLIDAALEYSSLVEINQRN